MSIPVIAFFNNKGGVGTTSTVYHVAWMLSHLGYRVIAADLDPQGNLTASFLDEDRLEQVLAHKGEVLTIYDAIKPLKQGTGDITEPHIESVGDKLGLIMGDMALSTFEDDLSEAWPRCLSGAREARSFRIMSAFWRIVQQAGRTYRAKVILLDLGPNLGAINRASLIAADYVIVPLGADLFSIQGLQNLGPALRVWRADWQQRRQTWPQPDIELPAGRIQPIGYMVLRHSIRLDRPVKAFERWMAKMPSTYRISVLNVPDDPTMTIAQDPHCIARLKDYRSLMPLAQEARKPMFDLLPADGALGAHTYSVNAAYQDFTHIAQLIALRSGLGPP